MIFLSSRLPVIFSGKSIRYHYADDAPIFEEIIKRFKLKAPAKQGARCAARRSSPETACGRGSHALCQSWPLALLCRRGGDDRRRTRRADRAPRRNGRALGCVRRVCPARARGRAGDERSAAAHASLAPRTPMVTVQPKASIVAGLLALFFTSRAEAAKRRFEPTDLDLLEPGTLEIDLQTGYMKSQGPGRLVLPDGEINLGLLPNFEINLDFAVGLEGPEHGPYAIDHVTADNLWLAVKLGLWDSRDPVRGTAWALGVQLGPKVPVAPGARGAGYEALLLVGRTFRGVQLGLNVGGVIDPGAEVSRRRPIGIEVGLDVEVELREGLSLLGEAGTTLYISPDRHALDASLGFQWSVNERLDLSLVGLFGFLPGSDRYGVLFGVTRRFELFHH